MSRGWAELTLAFLVFTVAHIVPTRPAIRRRLVGLGGERSYLALYSIVSVALLGWLIVAAGRAPRIPLWPPERWQAWTLLVMMALACMLVAFGVGIPNPFSIGGGDAARFDPRRPGIVGITRHPVLWAVALWAGAHVLANGDLAHVLVFGAFLLMALMGILMLDRRARQRLGELAWHRLAARRRPAWHPTDFGLRLVAAAALYMALLHAHEPVIGVDPMAWL